MYGKSGNERENLNGTVHRCGKFSDKKNNASRGITFFQLLPKRPVFSVSFVFTGARLSCRGVAKNVNGTTRGGWQRGLEPSLDDRPS